MAEVTRYVPVAALAVGCALVFGAREQLHMQSAAPMSAVRLDFPGYKVTDVVVPDEERRVAGMSDYTNRTFARDSSDPGFGVYVGYYDYQQQGKTIHSPKNCLPGAGWEPMDVGVRTLQGAAGPFAVNRYVLAKTGAQAVVYYWYQGRGRVEPNEYRVKWNLMRDAALHGRTEEALVRIVVPVVLGATRAPEAVRVARGRADSIATSVAAQLMPAVRAVLPGSPTAAAAPGVTASAS